VKALRRPTLAAWLINRAALTSPGLTKELDEASRELESAQARALEGAEDAAAQWRAAAERERSATAALIEAAVEAGREAGHSASPGTVEAVDETVRAAATDSELRDRILRGRVEREGSAATLGTLASAPPRKRQRQSAKRRDRAQARREVERLEEELAKATAREEQHSAAVERTAATLGRERKILADAKRDTTAIGRRLKAARKT